MIQTADSPRVDRRKTLAVMDFWALSPVLASLFVTPMNFFFKGE